jgi:hypothetical protein
MEPAQIDAPAMATSVPLRSTGQPMMAFHWAYEAVQCIQRTSCVCGPNEQPEECLRKRASKHRLLQTAPIERRSSQGLSREPPTKPARSACHSPLRHLGEPFANRTRTIQNGRREIGKTATPSRQRVFGATPRNSLGHKYSASCPPDCPMLPEGLFPYPSSRALECKLVSGSEVGVVSRRSPRRARGV